MNKKLIAYVANHTIRGACTCRACTAAGMEPEKHQPQGHTADLIFFKVGLSGNPTAEEFKSLIEESKFDSEFGPLVDPLDGQEHGYMELGAWFGDQGAALQFMGLGTLLGLWRLITPRILKGLSEDDVRRLAGVGFVTIIAVKKEETLAIAE